jgi:hypothetical protein
MSKSEMRKISDFQCLITTPTTCSIISAIKSFQSIPPSLSHARQSYEVQGISDQILTTCLAAQIPIPESIHVIISGQPGSPFDRDGWFGNVPSITIPDSILSIDCAAFSNCEDLTTLGNLGWVSRLK